MEDRDFLIYAYDQLDKRRREKLKYFASRLVMVEHCKLTSRLFVKAQCWYYRNRKDILIALCFLPTIIIYLIVKAVAR